MMNGIDWMGYHALRILGKAVCGLPEDASVSVGKVLGGIAYYLTSRRETAYADMKAAFKHEKTETEIRRLVKKHFESLGQLFIEMLRAPLFTRTQMDRMVESPHFDRYVHAASEGKGTICLTAHLGNWEYAQFVMTHRGHPVIVLNRPQRHPRMNAYLNQLRGVYGAKSIATGMGIRGLYKALKDKQAIGLLGDSTPRRDTGVILPFFERKTVFATGAFDLADRTGSVIFPCFMVRGNGFHFEYFMEESIPVNGDYSECPENTVKNYVRTLENFIRRYPDQWLWGSKRWKHSWTKRILVLSDGKPGHEKPAKAVAAAFSSIETQYGRPGMEYRTETITAAFKSKWHRRLFPLFVFLTLPWAQGHLERLKLFLTPETIKKILPASADFVISAGASLTPLNFYLAKDSRAKSIVLMTPSFPWNLFSYELAIIPAHDRTWTAARKTARLLLTPTDAGDSALQADLDLVKPHLKSPEKIKFALLIGGDTRRYRMSLSDIELFYSVLQRISKKFGDYVITTSRRTSETITQYLYQRVLQDPHCQMFVDGRKDTRREIIGGMMAIAQVLIVTEDSVSMISEAVSTGKKVIVLTLAEQDLPAKHRRFKKLLQEKQVISVARPKDFEKILDQVWNQQVRSELKKDEMSVIAGKLKEIL